jgi:hypothetical protein
MGCLALDLAIAAATSDSDGARAASRWVALTFLRMQRSRKSVSVVERSPKVVSERVIILGKLRKATLEIDCYFLRLHGEIREPCLQWRPLS